MLLSLTQNSSNTKCAIPTLVQLQRHIMYHCLSISMSHIMYHTMSHTMYHTMYHCLSISMSHIMYHTMSHTMYHTMYYTMYHCLSMSMSHIQSSNKCRLHSVPRTRFFGKNQVEQAIFPFQT